jgi:hypothetical protein
VHARGKYLGLDAPIIIVNPLRFERSRIKICIFVLQSLAARAQAVAEGKLSRSPKVDPMCSLGHFPVSTLNLFRLQGDGGRLEEGASEDQGSSEEPQGEDRRGSAG